MINEFWGHLDDALNSFVTMSEKSFVLTKLVVPGVMKPFFSYP